MLLEVGQSSKRCWTLVAFVWHFASVCSMMQLQCLLFCKAFWAKVASVRSFSSVCPDVGRQGEFCAEAFFAVWALEGFFSRMFSDMTLKMILVPHSFAADVTLVVGLFRVMRDCMHLKVLHFSEGL